MICGVLRQALYFFGQVAIALIAVAGFGLPLLAYGGAPGAQHQFLALYGVLCLGLLAGVVAHELGCLLACRAVGAEVKAFWLGGRRALIRFRAGTVQVSLGWPYRGRVEYSGALFFWRRAVITLAGSLTELALAGLVLASGAAAASGQGVPPLVVAAADGLAMGGLVNLMPYRTRSGELTDGVRLFELRSGIAAARLLAVRRTAAWLLRAGRAAELLELHARLDVPVGWLSVAQAANLALVELNVALLSGRLPDDAAQLAERRLSALTRRQDLAPAAPAAYLTLALLRLRQGDTHGYAEAERLCERALAGRDVRDPMRRMALAAVIMSRQARGLPHADVRAAAAATPVPAGHSPEAMAAELSAVFDPDTALRAFRHGDPGARLGAGSIAVLLRRQGRTGELLELHAGFGRPAGPHELEQARSLQDVEYNVLLVPDLPRQVLDEAASRVEWVAANHPHGQQEDPVHHAALAHTLAVARLRQGRFAEVEPLCAPSLAADVGPDNRATVLATIVLAGRALGQPAVPGESAATVRDDLRRLPAAQIAPWDPPHHDASG
jgi:hypothetical protein